MTYAARKRKKKKSNPQEGKPRMGTKAKTSFSVAESSEARVSF